MPLSTPSVAPICNEFPKSHDEGSLLESDYLFQSISSGSIQAPLVQTVNPPLHPHVAAKIVSFPANNVVIPQNNVATPVTLHLPASNLPTSGVASASNNDAKPA